MKLYNELKQELYNILTYWMQNTIDHKNGGFFGEVNNLNEVNTEANKGIILNARILWTFSAAYNTIKSNQYLVVAKRAYEYIMDNFIDKQFGGVYWEVDAKGSPVNDRKQIYALSFAIYGLSEYYKATNEEAALQFAIGLFENIEEYSFDPKYNGYVEALSRDWSPLEDVRLSDKDENAVKTMNTHLHILEAYTNLYRIWKDRTIKEQLENLIIVFLEKIIQADYHFGLFFNEKWEMSAKKLSYGHDIEGSWLIYEAAEVLGDEELLKRVEDITLKMASKVASEGGITDDYAVLERCEPNTTPDDNEREWWPQAEGIVGFYNAFQISGNEKYLTLAENIWEYTKNNILDKKYGEWFWMVDKNGVPNSDFSKVGFWKCPYHNGRGCIEIINRVEQQVTV